MVALIGLNDRMFDATNRRLERIALDGDRLRAKPDFPVDLATDNPLQPVVVVRKRIIKAQMGASALLPEKG